MLTLPGREWWLELAGSLENAKEPGTIPREGRCRALAPGKSDGREKFRGDYITRNGHRLSPFVRQELLQVRVARHYA